MIKLNRSLIFWVLSSTIIFSSAFGFLQCTASKQKLYTAYNIWHVPKENMFCINYKYGSKIIPAGTEVSNVKVMDWARDGFIYFHVVKDGKPIKIKLVDGILK